MYLAICQYPIDMLAIAIYNECMSYTWKWTAAIDRESLPSLQDLAEELGFIVTSPGGLNGRPSPAAMLDALAAAYRLDPAGTLDVLRTLLVPPATNAPDA